MEKFRPYRVLTVLTLTLLVLFAAIHAANVYAVDSATTLLQQDDPVAPEGANPAPSCRYGVAVLNAEQTPSVDTLGAGWFLNFGISPPPGTSVTNGAEFVHVVKVYQEKSGANYLDGYIVSPPLPNLGNQIDNNPGNIWIVGNEVDRGPDPGQTVSPQGDMHADMYARAYHDLYHFIKQRDPSALVAVSALVQVTPGRIQYLNMVYDAYKEMYGMPMPVDIWNMHLYVLPEVLPNRQPNGIAGIALGTDPAIAISERYDPTGNGNPANFKDSCPRADVYCYAEHDSMQAFAEQVVRMRQWMASKGYRNRPLILSEYSLLLPYQYAGSSDLFYDEFGQTFNPARVETFMRESFEYLSTATDPNLGFPDDGNRLIQQWLWFSVRTDAEGSVSNLIQNETTGALTNLGQLFQSSVQAEPNTINLYPSWVNSPYAFTNGAGTVNVTLEAKVGNNGTSTSGAFTVTFYRDAARTQAIGSVNVPAQTMTGCGTRNISVSVPWNDVTPGRHHFWAVVDSAGSISESDEADNVLRGTVYVDPLQIFLPNVSG